MKKTDELDEIEDNKNGDQGEKRRKSAGGPVKMHDEERNRN